MTAAETLAFVHKEQETWSPLVAKFVKTVNKK